MSKMRIWLFKILKLNPNFEKKNHKFLKHQVLEKFVILSYLINTGKQQKTVLTHDQGCKRDGILRDGDCKIIIFAEDFRDSGTGKKRDKFLCGTGRKLKK